MPRTARIIFPNFPHHIVQRGHNRKAVFLEETDYQYYLKNMEEWKLELGLKVYSYCLMTNHVHLIVEPGDDPSSVSEFMKRLAGRQTRLVNRIEGRSGSLWEGRFKASPIQRDAYLLQCCRYVELNPVKANMVQKPEDYPWSSYRARVGIIRNNWLDSDQLYIGLSSTRSRREKKYRGFVENGVGTDDELIRCALARNQLTGTPSFVDEIELRFKIRIEARGRGRPKK